MDILYYIVQSQVRVMYIYVSIVIKCYSVRTTLEKEKKTVDPISRKLYLAVWLPALPRVYVQSLKAGRANLLAPTEKGAAGSLATKTSNRNGRHKTKRRGWEAEGG